MSEGITLQALFFKATTTIDGGWRISLDVNADQAKEVMQLSQMKDSILQVAIIPLPEFGGDFDGPTAA